jgi:hypothetical protein
LHVPYDLEFTTAHFHLLSTRSLLERLLAYSMIMKAEVEPSRNIDSDYAGFASKIARGQQLWYNIDKKYLVITSQATHTFWREVIRIVDISACVQNKNRKLWYVRIRAHPQTNVLQ